MSDLLSLIGRIVGCRDKPLIESDILEFQSLVTSKVLRDYDFPPELYLVHLSILKQGFLSGNSEYEKICWDIWIQLVNFPEFDEDKAAMVYTASDVDIILERYFGKSLRNGMWIPHVKFWLYWLYEIRVDLRGHLRVKINKLLLGLTRGRFHECVESPLKALLEVLRRIIDGMATPISYKVTMGLVSNLLLPLHSSNEMTLWRDQIPVLQVYHTELIAVLVAIVKKAALMPFYPTSDRSESKEHHRAQYVSSLGRKGMAIVQEEEEEEEENKEKEDGKKGEVFESSNSSSVASSVSILVKILKSLTTFVSEGGPTPGTGGVWPRGHMANTPKEVLLLHELGILAKTAKGFHLKDLYTLPPPDSQESEYEITLKTILPRICSCLRSDNFRIQEKALEIFKRPSFLDGCDWPKSTDADGDNSSSSRSSKKRVAGADLSESEGILSSIELHRCVRRRQQLAMELLLPAVYQNGTIFWNPTVNRWRALGLERFIQWDMQSKACSCEGCSGGDSFGSICADLLFVPSVQNQGQSQSQSQCYSKSVETLDLKGVYQQSAQFPSQTTSISGTPVSISRPSFGRMEPSQRQSVRVGVNGRGFHGTNWVAGSSAPPPVTVTGVAPWAMAQAKAHTGTGPAGICTPGDPTMPLSKYATTMHTIRPPIPSTAIPKMNHPVPGAGSNNSYNMLSSEQVINGSISESKLLPTSPTQRQTHSVEEIAEAVSVFKAHINRLRPDGFDGEDKKRIAGERHSRALHSFTPTLLPSLKFHDLVFGADIGSGAFSVVRYAKRIMGGGSGRSEWPEYAVKVILTDKLKELGYENNVSRELAALNILAHPGVARLVSSFRYTSGAYLVLEYASRGDLHTLLTKCGALSVKQSRFIIGECIAALTYVHSNGLSFGDMKPENILITAAGHIKLTDFGGCRAVTAVGRDLLQGSLDALSSLRSGDWRPTEEDARATFTASDGGSATSSGGDTQDSRMEGTPAYMSPESLIEMVKAVMVSQSSDVISAPAVPISMLANDSWALGCVLVFLLKGTPMFFGSPEEVALQHVREKEVSMKYRLDSGINTWPFTHASGAGASASAGVRFSTPAVHEQSKIAASEPALVDFATSLLAWNPSDRMHISHAGRHIFFTEDIGGDGRLDIDVLYSSTPPELPTPSEDQGGEEKPADESGWGRRQCSHIWAPLVHTYSDADESEAIATPTPSVGSESGVNVQENPRNKTGAHYGDIPIKIPLSRRYSTSLTETELERDASFDSSDT